MLEHILSGLKDSANAYVFCIVYMPLHVDRWFFHSIFNEPEVASELLHQIAPKYSDRIWMMVAIKKHCFDDLFTKAKLPNRQEAKAELAEQKQQKEPTPKGPSSYQRFYQN